VIALDKATGAVEVSVQPEPAIAVAEVTPVPTTVVVRHEEEQGENLDIPAFMRRGGL
jgi:cell division protein FtsZ